MYFFLILPISPGADLKAISSTFAQLYEKKNDQEGTEEELRSREEERESGREEEEKERERQKKKKEEERLKNFVVDKVTWQSALNCFSEPISFSVEVGCSKNCSKISYLPFLPQKQNQIKGYH